MSKIIIIPDIHNRVQWIESTLSKLDYDKVIFTGDYFDDYNDTSLDIEAAAEWLKQSVREPDRIHLYGTHDLFYRFPYNMSLLASGNSPEKERIINSILDRKDWDVLKLVHYEQEFLFTHAGVHPFLIREYIYRHDIDTTEEDFVSKVILPATDEAYSYAEDGDAHPWLSAGYSRGGRQHVGGITWLDWIEEFELIEGLNQIVGHTEINFPDAKNVYRHDSMKGSYNYNLDTRGKYIGILENGQLTWQKR